jgi:hypothetical protein
VDAPPGGEQTVNVPAQVGVRLGTVLDGGNRVQPGVEAAEAHPDDPTQRRHCVSAPPGRYEGELRHAIPLAKTAAALRKIRFPSSKRFTSRRSRSVSASSALCTA